jgi:hypothetical protein
MNKQGHSNSNSQQSSLIKWRDDFIRSKRLRWSPKTKRCYESILNLYIQYVGEDHWPPTRTGILDWLNSVQEQASETTAATYWRHLKAWLNYLEAVGALDWQSNPIYLIKKLGLQPREADEDYASFDEEELKQLYQLS